MTTEQTLKQPARIKYALALQDYTQSAIAKECGVKPTTVGAVIHGRSRSKAIENRIASITRIPLAELWPQWHGPAAKHRRRPTTGNRGADALRAVMG